jgi:hypothetical protein
MGFVRNKKQNNDRKGKLPPTNAIANAGMRVRWNI